MFSLKSLLVAVAISGLGTAGLIHRTQFWASTMIAMTLGILLFGICRTWYGSSCSAFWGPFALVGGVYLAIVSLQPLADMHYNLPTTQLVVFGLEKLTTPPAGTSPDYVGLQSTTVPVTGGYAAPMVSSYVVPQIAGTPVSRPALFGMATTVYSGDGIAADARAFLLVAQCLWCLLLAAVAGIVCSWTVRRREASRKPALGTDAG
jgi:hypothetical protein